MLGVGQKPTSLKHIISLIFFLTWHSPVLFYHFNPLGDLGSKRVTRSRRLSVVPKMKKGQGESSRKVIQIGHLGERGSTTRKGQRPEQNPSEKSCGK